MRRSHFEQELCNSIMPVDLAYIKIGQEYTTEASFVPTILRNEDL